MKRGVGLGIGGFVARELTRSLLRMNKNVAPTIAEKVSRNAPATTAKLNELGKTLAKHGPDGITGKSGYEKMLADDRINHLVKPPFKLDVHQAVQELSEDRHLRLDYVTNLLSKVHRKDEVRTIIKYLKSTAADNLTPDQRAHLLISALEKLKYIDIIGQFLG